MSLIYWEYITCFFGGIGEEIADTGIAPRNTPIESKISPSLSDPTQPRWTVTTLCLLLVVNYLIAWKTDK